MTTQIRRVPEAEIRAIHTLRAPQDTLPCGARRLVFPQRTCMGRGIGRSGIDGEPHARSELRGEEATDTILNGGIDREPPFRRIRGFRRRQLTFRFRRQFIQPRSHFRRRVLWV